MPNETKLGKPIEVFRQGTKRNSILDFFLTSFCFILTILLTKTNNCKNTRMKYFLSRSNVLLEKVAYLNNNVYRINNTEKMICQGHISTLQQFTEFIQTEMFCFFCDFSTFIYFIFSLKKSRWVTN